SHRLEVRDLVSLRAPIAAAEDAYRRLLQGGGGPIGVILEYPSEISNNADMTRVVVARSAPVGRVRAPRDRIGIGLIGAGSFAANVLIPTLKRTGGVRFTSVASASGLSAFDAVRKHRFARAASGARAVIEDPEVDAVVIATTHDVHTSLAIDALAAGKPVFV